MEHIILIKPNGTKTYNAKLQHIKAIEPPILLLCLSKLYNTTHLIDAELYNFSTQETVDTVLAFNPDRVVILATGNHPSACYQQIDEMIKLDILLSPKVKVESHSKLPFDPTQSGFPRHDLIDYNKYKCHNWHSWSNHSKVSPYGVLFTSISCPFSCNFCSVKNFYGEKYSERPLEDIYKDLDFFASKNIINIKILDELFVFSKQRVMDICNYIISKGYKFNIWAYARIDIMDKDLLYKMKLAGINWLAYGIESGNEQIRRGVIKGSFTNDKIREVIKMTKDNGIYCLGNYMFGFWEDRYQTMRETLDFAVELNCEFANFYCVVAYPNSSLYDEMLEKKVKLPVNYSEYSQTKENFKPLPTKYIDAHDVLMFRDNAFNEYYNTYSYNKNMVEKFGVPILQELAKMTSITIKRDWA